VGRFVLFADLLHAKRVFANTHGSHGISAIDAKPGQVVGPVNAEGDGEEAVPSAFSAANWRLLLTVYKAGAIVL